MHSANIQDGPAGLVIGDKVLESPLAEISPQWHLEVNGFHRLRMILSELVLGPFPIFWEE